MINTAKHKFYMMQVLKDIYSDAELANCSRYFRLLVSYESSYCR